MEHMYDGALHLKLPRGVDKVTYADDLALVTSSRSVPELKTIADIAVRMISDWMRGRGLMLALRKTEVVAVRKRRYDYPPVVSVDGHEVPPSKEISYLRVRLEVNQ